MLGAPCPAAECSQGGACGGPTVWQVSCMARELRPEPLLYPVSDVAPGAAASALPPVLQRQRYNRCCSVRRPNVGPDAVQPHRKPYIAQHIYNPTFSPELMTSIRSTAHAELSGGLIIDFVYYCGLRPRRSAHQVMRLFRSLD